MSLDLRNVSYSYKKGNEVVSGFSLSLAATETAALMGPSGSGKSTVLGISGLLLKPSEGEVLFGGENAWATRPRPQKGKIGWIFQNLSSLPGRSVLDNVTVSLLASGTSRSEAIEPALLALESVGLVSLRHRKVEELSGGQLQRVSVARAIAAKPLLLLADEPTGQLDQQTSSTVMAALSRAVRTYGIPMLVATHDPGVAATCGTIVQL